MELSLADDDARAPAGIVAGPLRGRHLPRPDLREAEAQEELHRPLVHRAGEDVGESAPRRLAEEPGDQALTDPLPLEARDGVEADDLPCPFRSVRRGQEPGDPRQVAVADGGAEADGEHLRDLVRRAQLEQPLALAALE